MFKNFVFLILIAGFSIVSGQTKPVGWIDGSGGNISNLDELHWLSETPVAWDEDWVQTADIDASLTSTWNVGNHDNDDGTTPEVAMGFAPIGDFYDYAPRYFTGSYNGNGFYIKNLYINRPANMWIALFGATSGATIENIQLLNCNITGGAQTAGIVGCMNNVSSIIQCFTTGTIVGEEGVGGIVGYNMQSLINKSYSLCSVSGTMAVGGCVGGNVAGESVIRNCFANGEITRLSGSETTFGGFCGTNTETIEYCYSLSDVFESSGIVWDEGDNGKDKGFIGSDNGTSNHNYFVYDEISDASFISNQSSAGGAVVKTKAEMQTVSTFTNGGWNFELTPNDGAEWDFDKNAWYYNGYPFLAWQNGTNSVYYVQNASPTDVSITGSGISVAPYQISTLEQLYWLSQNESYWDKEFLQTANIDASATVNWEDGNSDEDKEGFWPIGREVSLYNDVYFTGKYDGNSYTIDGLFIKRKGGNDVCGHFVGFIGGCFGGEISNLGITNLDYSGYYNMSNHKGGVAGAALNSTITKCFSTGILAGNYEVGGLAGLSWGTTISQCYSKCNVSGAEETTGSLIGKNTGTISNCYSTGNTTRLSGASAESFSAFCGYNEGAVEYCYSIGSVFYDGESNPTNKGFIGVSSSDPVPTYTSNFFDSEVSNQSNGTGATEKNSTDMTANNTFLDAEPSWSAEIWNIGDGINNGYPYLKWQKTDGTSLPVELISFTASIVEEGVELAWQTATEVNNYGFCIERAIYNSECIINNWKEIGFVEGHGNSNSPKYYEYIDKDLSDGEVEYRLKQIDTDGNYKYYNTTAKVDIKITDVNDNTGLPREFALDQNYPNPFNPSTTINYSIPVEDANFTSSTNVVLIVYDMLGREVAILVNKEQTAGNYNVNFDASKLTSGMYIYRITAGDFAQSRKMLLIK